MTHSSPSRSWPLLNPSKSLICTLILYFIDTGGVLAISRTVLHSSRSERGRFRLWSSLVNFEGSPSSRTTELAVVHFTFYKRLWCMGSPCCICLQFLFHGHTSFYYFGYLSTNDHPVFMFNSDPFEVIRNICLTFTTNFQCRNQMTSIAFHE